MSQQTAVFYTIHVEGHLDTAWSPDLYGLEIIPGQDGTTRLIGTLADQAALLGCLHRLVNLGARLLSVDSQSVQINKGKVNMLPQLTTTTEAEKDKILVQIERMRQGWNSADGTLYAEPFTADADYTVWNGIYVQGQTTIAAQHQHIFDTFYANTTLHFGEKQVRFVRDDVALVRVEARLTRPDGTLAGPYPVRPLFVFVKEDEQWLIAAFQNTPVIQEIV